MNYSMLVWAGFAVFILLMLSLDLGLFNRKSHSISYREAATWSAVWVTLALVFAGLIYFQPEFLGIKADTAGLKFKEFITGYLIELSLSVDNLFVFLLIFSYFKVPGKFQHRVLFWGVLGALVMRVTMIFLGATLIDRFEWIIYIFGAFLVYTGIKMFSSDEIDVNPEDNRIVKLFTRFMPISREYDGDKFFTRAPDGTRTGTLLLLVLIIVEVTDLVFAVDSIPAIFGITTDPFIIYTSNVFAIMGLRSLYFLLAGVVEKFHYLQKGLAIVLTFIGVKMLLTIFHIHIPIEWSLGFVAVVLVGSIVASVLFPGEVESNIEPSIPPDFHEETPEVMLNQVRDAGEDVK